MERPNLAYGGPSPRIRAFASQDRLTRNYSAASTGVSRRPPLSARAPERSCAGRLLAGIALRLYMTVHQHSDRRDVYVLKSR